MNDVSLNKKKIKMFKGENQRKVVDRAYMHEDIKKILDVSEPGDIGKSYRIETYGSTCYLRSGLSKKSGF